MSLSAQILADLAGQLKDWDSALYSGTTIYGIYDAEYQEVLGAESGKPAFACLTSDVSGISHGATLAVTSELYNISALSRTVVNVQHAPADLGPGMTRLVFRNT